MNNYSPLLQFHGFEVAEIEKTKKILAEHLKDKISEKNYENLTFSAIETKVQDVNGKDRPFLRMYSSEYDMVHTIRLILEQNNWKYEIEFIKITNYFDLRDS